MTRTITARALYRELFSSRCSVSRPAHYPADRAENANDPPWSRTSQGSGRDPLREQPPVRNHRLRKTIGKLLIAGTRGESITQSLPDPPAGRNHKIFLTLLLSLCLIRFICLFLYSKTQKHLFTEQSRKGARFHQLVSTRNREGTQRRKLGKERRESIRCAQRAMAAKRAMHMHRVVPGARLLSVRHNDTDATRCHWCTKGSEGSQPLPLPTRGSS